jgi:hypothetical protein
MTDGMKSGAGSDPFSDDTGDHETSEAKQETPDNDTGKSSGSDSDSQTEKATSSVTGSSDSDTAQSEDRLPYIFARNTVKSDRKMIQYFLRDETQAVEKDAQRTIEEELGTDVSLIDIREALVLVGAKHLDEVADELRDWGYRLKEE